MGYWEDVYKLREKGLVERRWKRSDLKPHLYAKYAYATLVTNPSNYSISPDGKERGYHVYSNPRAWRLGDGVFELIEDPEDNGKERVRQRERVEELLKSENDGEVLPKNAKTSEPQTFFRLIPESTEKILDGTWRDGPVLNGALMLMDQYNLEPQEIVERFLDSRFLLDVPIDVDISWFRAAYIYTLLVTLSAANPNADFSGLTETPSFLHLPSKLEDYLEVQNLKVFNDPTPVQKGDVNEVLDFIEGNEDRQIRLQTLFLSRVIQFYCLFFKAMNDPNEPTVEIRQGLIQSLIRIVSLPFSTRSSTQLGLEHSATALASDLNTRMVIRNMTAVSIKWEDEECLKILYISNEINGMLGMEESIWEEADCGFSESHLVLRYLDFLRQSKGSEGLRETNELWTNLITETFEMVSVCSDIDTEAEYLSSCDTQSSQYLAYVFGRCAAEFTNIALNQFDTPIQATRYLRRSIDQMTLLRRKERYKVPLEQMDILLADFQGTTNWEQMLDTYELKWQASERRDSGTEMWPTHFRHLEDGPELIPSRSDLFWAMKAGFAAGLADTPLRVMVSEDILTERIMEKVTRIGKNWDSSRDLTVNCWETFNEIEVCLHGKVVEALIETYGSDETEWWGNRVPRPIRDACALRAVEENTGQPHHTYLNFIHLLTIMEKNKKAMGFLLKSSYGSDWNHFAKDLKKANTIRKNLDHQLRNIPITNEDLDFLSGLLVDLRGEN